MSISIVERKVIKAAQPVVSGEIVDGRHYPDTITTYSCGCRLVRKFVGAYFEERRWIRECETHES